MVYYWPNFNPLEISLQKMYTPLSDKDYAKEHKLIPVPPSISLAVLRNANNHTDYTSDDIGGGTVDNPILLINNYCYNCYIVS